ncbi:hypothetical protein [Hyphococcus sp.]|uniref:hypothetical protein n=1 Tax=Hyphococcus sp. TaxID=2038636 RepID=UPI002084C21A|nr:MAG: hypothetical protein DHS20C04_09160 [Marinicaulis sp.]
MKKHRLSRVAMLLCKPHGFSKQRRLEQRNRRIDHVEIKIVPGLKDDIIRVETVEIALSDGALEAGRLAGVNDRPVVAMPPWKLSPGRLYPLACPASGTG